MEFWQADKWFEDIIKRSVFETVFRIFFLNCDPCKIGKLLIPKKLILYLKIIINKNII